MDSNASLHYDAKVPILAIFSLNPSYSIYCYPQQTAQYRKFLTSVTQFGRTIQGGKVKQIRFVREQGQLGSDDSQSKDDRFGGGNTFQPEFETIFLQYFDHVQILLAWTEPQNTEHENYTKNGMNGVGGGIGIHPGSHGLNGISGSFTNLTNVALTPPPSITINGLNPLSGASSSQGSTSQSISNVSQSMQNIQGMQNNIMVTNGQGAQNNQENSHISNQGNFMQSGQMSSNLTTQSTLPSSMHFVNNNVGYSDTQYTSFGTEGITHGSGQNLGNGTLQGNNHGISILSNTSNMTSNISNTRSPDLGTPTDLQQQDVKLLVSNTQPQQLKINLVSKWIQHLTKEQIEQLKTLNEHQRFQLVREKILALEES